MMTQIQDIEKTVPVNVIVMIGPKITTEKQAVKLIAEPKLVVATTDVIHNKGLMPRNNKKEPVEQRFCA